MRLRIEKMVYGGAGLAHVRSGAGRALFVPFTLPDEVVEARLVEERDGFAEAALVRVVEGRRIGWGRGVCILGSVVDVSISMGVMARSWR